jgi:glycosyltransferase involved in cell wall biosynthesis
MLKFSEDFPVFYKSATKDLPVSFRVMGWSKELSAKYSWFDFSGWDLLKTNQEPTQKFLESIDVFIYNCNHRFIENQSRAIIESQLTGCPIVAPNKWNFPNMIWNQRTGFLWDDLDELRSAMRDLIHYEFRTNMGKIASDCTRDIWCNSESAIRKWNAVLNYAGS